MTRRLLFWAAGGGAVGFLYYYFVGCSTGTCPITSNPWISSGYGAMIGALLGSGSPRKPEDKASADADGAAPKDGPADPPTSRNQP